MKKLRLMATAWTVGIIGGVIFTVISKKRIRPFQDGAGAIARRAKPMIVPIWTEGGDKILPNRSCGSEFYWALPRLWKRMDVIIGDPLTAPDNLKTDELIGWLEDRLLELADTS